MTYPANDDVGFFKDLVYTGRIWSMLRTISH